RSRTSAQVRRSARHEPRLVASFTGLRGLRPRLGVGRCEDGSQERQRHVGARVEGDAAVKPEDFDRMLAHCKKLVAANQTAYVDPDTLSMARFIIDTLGTEFPCGFAEPHVVSAPDGDVVVIDDVEFGCREEAI